MPVLNVPTDLGSELAKLERRLRVVETRPPTLSSGSIADGSIGTVKLAATNHALFIGSGSAVTELAPGTSGLPLVSQGSSADPTYGTIDLTVAATGTLPVTAGGIGVASPSAHKLLIGNGSSAMTQLTPHATSGMPLLSAGTSSDPAYGAIDLTSSTIVTGALPVNRGGSGLAALTAHNLLIGNATSAATLLAPGTQDYPLASNGASADPSYTTVTPSAIAVKSSNTVDGLYLAQSDSNVTATPDATTGFRNGSPIFISNTRTITSTAAWASEVSGFGLRAIMQIEGQINWQATQGTHGMGVAWQNWTNYQADADGLTLATSFGAVNAPVISALTGRAVSGFAVQGDGGQRISDFVGVTTLRTWGNGSMVANIPAIGFEAQLVVQPGVTLQERRGVWVADPQHVTYIPYTAARLATTAALPTCTYANGSSGVGATLTATANGALTVDSVAVANSDRVLVKNQASAAQNGIYTQTTLGDGSHAFVLTRATDADTGAELVRGGRVSITVGTVNTGTLWVINSIGTPVVGTDTIYWVADRTITQNTGIQIDALSQGTKNTAILYGTDTTSADTTPLFKVPQYGGIYCAVGTLGTGYIVQGIGNATLPKITLKYLPSGSIAVSASDILGRYSWEGYTGTAFVLGAKIEAVASEGFTASHAGTDLQFYTTANASVTPAVRFGITHDDKVYFGPSSGSAYVQVTSAGLTMGSGLVLDLGSAAVASAGGFTITGSTGAINVGATLTAQSDITQTAGTATLQVLHLQNQATFQTSGGTTPAFNIPAGTLQTTPADGDFEMDGSCFYGCSDAGNRGVIPIEHFIRQHADRGTFATGTAQQAIFDSVANGTITLEIGTYFFEALIQVKSMSATSGNLKFSLKGAGTVTFANILYTAMGIDSADDQTTAWSGVSEIVSTQTAVDLATAGTAQKITFLVKGTFEATVGGTLIPSVAQTTSVGTAVTTAGSYFRCYRVGVAAALSVGQWT